MARITRHGSARRKLYRRSREARRLSEGGGWAAPPPTTGPGPDVPQQQQQQQVDIGKLTEDDIDSACLFVFNFPAMQQKLMKKDDFLQCELDGLCETKALYDSKITNLKKTTKSPDSQKLKQIKFATRESMELGELITDCNKELQEVNFLKTKTQAIFESHVSVLSQYADQEDEGSMIGFLARIMRAE